MPTVWKSARASAELSAALRLCATCLGVAAIGSSSGRRLSRRCLSRAEAQSRREVWGVADDHRDAELGWASRADANGLEVLDVEGWGERSAALRLCAICLGVSAIGSSSGWWWGRRRLSRAEAQRRREVWGVADARRDAELGWASRSGADGLGVAKRPRLR